MAKRKKQDITLLRDQINKIDTGVIKTPGAKEGFEQKCDSFKGKNLIVLSEIRKERPNYLTAWLNWGKKRDLILILSRSFMRSSRIQSVFSRITFRLSWIPKGKRNYPSKSQFRELKDLTAIWQLKNTLLIVMLILISFLRKDSIRLSDSVEKGEADLAILRLRIQPPAALMKFYDLLLHTTLSIIGEERFQVKHCLIGAGDIPIHK